MEHAKNRKRTRISIEKPGNSFIIWLYENETVDQVNFERQGPNYGQGDGLEGGRQAPASGIQSSDFQTF
ncbi:MAG: hypothetical protein ACI4PD_03100 [Butyricicoccus sp.]